MCECWFHNGVVRTARGKYCCANCEEDVSDAFMLLSRRDEEMADHLIQKGEEGQAKD